ncbi:methyltransferase, FxLD system [Streptomyces sp. BI20]|uniref:methyltransferase, FxLD system n=1 Tax=Streptomyces sp. BI20 TaxID=3403460 RepID=UPI003C78B0EB
MTDTTEDRATTLRLELVEALVKAGDLTEGSTVHVAFLAVPRHLYLPGESLERAYANTAVVTKRNKDGGSISSVSQPSMVAQQLTQLDVRPGMSVLEIGSGGYQAHLLRHLVGEEGSVTSVDIDADVTDRAESCLAAAGVKDVRVVLSDGEYGAHDFAPYDRIVVTAGAWDVPRELVAQMDGDGRLVTPLRMRGLTRSLALEHRDGRLSAVSARQCGFVPMQGDGGHDERRVLLHGTEVALRIDESADLGVDTESLATAVEQIRHEEWTGVTVAGGEPFEDLEMWLATLLPGYCRLASEKTAVDRGVVKPALPWGGSAAVHRGSFAYLTLRAVDAGYEFGVYAHGADAEQLAGTFAGAVVSWDAEQRQGDGPKFDIFPAGTPDERLPEGRVIDKRHTRLTISWP